MRKRHRRTHARKVDRLLGRNQDETGRDIARTFSWTYSLDHPSRPAAPKKKSRLPRTRE